MANSSMPRSEHGSGTSPQAPLPRQSGEFREIETAMLLVDIVNSLNAVRHLSELQVGALFNDFYLLCHQSAEANDGRVIKHIGDSALMLFAPGAAQSLVATADAIRTEFEALCARHGTRTEVSFNAHQGSVVHGRFGANGNEDVLGNSVNTLFKLSSGPGFWMSERLYRKLPNEARGPWQKIKPPVVYVRRG